MRDCTPSFEQSGGAEDKRSSADRGYIARSRSLPPDEIQRIGIGKKRVHATATRYADKIELRALGKGCGRQYREAAICPHRFTRLPNKDHFRTRDPRQHLVWAGEIQLSDVRKK